MAMTAPAVENAAAPESSSGLFVHPGNAVLRRAVQENVVSFPSQVPVLSRQSRPDVQCRAVVLYFVHGWTMSEIGAHYGFPDSRIAQILNEWAVRAFALGFIQVIDPERFAALAERPSETLVRMPVRPAAPKLRVSPCSDVPLVPVPVTEPAPPESVLDALDRAIDSCKSQGGEFWFHLAAALGSFRAAVEAAGNLQSGDPGGQIGSGLRAVTGIRSLPAEGANEALPGVA